LALPASEAALCFVVVLVPFSCWLNSLPILLDEAVIDLNLPVSFRNLKVVVEGLHVEDILMTAVSLLI
jgi:hypothetical protein